METENLVMLTNWRQKIAWCWQIGDRKSRDANKLETENLVTCYLYCIALCTVYRAEQSKPDEFLEVKLYTPIDRYECGTIFVKIGSPASGQ